MVPVGHIQLIQLSERNVSAVAGLRIGAPAAHDPLTPVGLSHAELSALRVRYQVDALHRFENLAPALIAGILYDRLQFAE